MTDMTQSLPSYIWKYDEGCEWCTTKSKFTAIIGGDSYGDPKTKFLQSLAWWDTDLTLRGKHIFLSDFDATMMSDCIYEAKLEYEDGKKDTDIDKPDKFSHSIWVSWE